MDYRIVREKGKWFVLDGNGNRLPPSSVQDIATEVVNTATAPAYVYVGFRPDDGAYKIGVTSNLDRRQSELKVEFLHVIKCDPYGELSSYNIEAALHKLFIDNGLHIDGEWFWLNDTTVSLIRRFCTSPKSTLDFITKFGVAVEMINAIVKSGENDGYAIAACRLIRKEISDDFTFAVFLHEIQAMYDLHKRDGEHELAAYYFAIGKVVAASRL